MRFISIIIIFVITATSCFYMRRPKQLFVVKQLDTTINVVKISIAELALNYKKYHGKYIETTGRFCQAFEEFAIYSDRDIMGESSGFWLDINQGLQISNKALDNMDGKKITVKGMVDTTNKGHLNSYLAEIGKIYYWIEE